MNLFQFIMNNPMMSGGLALGGTGAAAALLRHVPEKIWYAIERQITVQIQVQEGRLFERISCWLDSQPYAKRARILRADVSFSEMDDRRLYPRIIFTPGVGHHLIRFEGHFIWFYKHSREGQYSNIESYTFHTFGRNQGIFRRLFESVEETYALAEREMTQVYIPNAAEGWKQITRRRPRPLESVILQGDIREDICADLKTFLDSREQYRLRGVPYRRGYLLYGPSGSGKSSFIDALAGEMKRDLYLLNLSKPGMDDGNLNALLLSVPAEGVLLIEDVDAAFEKRDKADLLSSKVTFSGLLNALDGVGTKDGQVIFLTTNHIDRLDEALIRPGRVDRKVLLANANRDQANRMFERFFPGSDKALLFTARMPDDKIKMAEIQGHLLQYDDPMKAVEEVPW